MFTFVFLFISGIFNGSMDALSYKFGASFFSKLNPQFWNPNLSWKNKWKNGDPKQGPNFLFSNNALVSLTDGWHLTKALHLFFIFLAIVFYNPVDNLWYDYILDFIICRYTYALGFVLIYNGPQIINWIVNKKLYIITKTKDFIKWLQKLSTFLRTTIQNLLK